MLEISAIISLALSFYNPSQEEELDTGLNRFVLPLVTTLYLDPYNINSHEDKYGFIESVAILFSILIIVFVSAGNDWSKERQFRGDLLMLLSSLSITIDCSNLGLQNRLETEQKINVRRDRSILEILVTDLVVGDICLVKYGDNHQRVCYVCFKS